MKILSWVTSEWAMSLRFHLWKTKIAKFNWSKVHWILFLAANTHHLQISISILTFKSWWMKACKRNPAKNLLWLKILWTATGAIWILTLNIRVFLIMSYSMRSKGSSFWDVSWPLEWTMVHLDNLSIKLNIFSVCSLRNGTNRQGRWFSTLIQNIFWLWSKFMVIVSFHLIVSYCNITCLISK